MRRSLRARLAPGLLEFASRTPTSLLLALRPVLAAALRAGPLRGRAQRSMAAALGAQGFEGRHVDAYFRHLADQAMFALAAYRCGIRGAGLDSHWELDPPSVERFRAALAAGRGALLVAPHLACHELAAGLAAAHLPIAMLARRSPDRRYQALKERWYRGLGAEVVHPPGRQLGQAGMGAIMRVLRKNRVLAITPDLVQRRGKGVPVRLFGRPVWLPAGPFFLAARAGAAFLPCFIRHEAGIYRVWAEPALLPAPGLDAEVSIADLAQRWATLLEQFLRRHPDMWQFWLDKRWSQWLERTCPGEESAAPLLRAPQPPSAG